MRLIRGRGGQRLVRQVQGCGLAGAVMLVAERGWACTACFGQSDSPLAAGMNWGILSLLGFILSVLAGLVASFVVLARRSASVTCLNQDALPARAEFESIREPEDEEGLSDGPSWRRTSAGQRRHDRAWRRGGLVAAQDARAGNEL